MRENSGSLDLNFISLPSPAADKNWVSWLSSAAVFVFWKWCLILRLFQSCKLSVNQNSSTTLSFVCDICVMLKSYDTAKYSSCVQASIWIFSLLCPIFTFMPNFRGQTLYPKASRSAEITVPLSYSYEPVTTYTLAWKHKSTLVYAEKKAE